MQKKEFPENLRLFKTVRLFLPVLTFILFSLSVSAQVCGTAATSIGLTCNTGVNINGLTINSVAPGNPDPYWQVSQNSSGGGSFAQVINPLPFAGGCNAPSPNNGSLPYGSWITSASWMCGGVPGNYSCTTVSDAYFTRQFFLPANQILNTNMLIFASDWIEDITVNGIMAYDNATITTKPYHRQFGLEFSWCNFKPGQVNTIIIHVKTIPNLSNQCKFIGIKVHTWGQGNTGWLSGPTTVCGGTTNQYSISPTLAAGVPTTVARTYSWTLPTGWSGNKTTNPITAIAGNSGILTAAMHSMSPTGPVCLGIAAQCVNVLPGITVSPTTFTLCLGNSMNLNASGATSYTWYAPGPVPIGNLSTVVISPTAAKTTYTCQGITSSGCVYTKTVQITTLQTPTISVSSHTPQVCQGQSVTLQASGALTYTWSNGPKVAQNIVAPGTTTQYTVTGKSINGCTATAVIAAVINPTPNVTINPSANFVCPGMGVNLTATGANSYSWSNGQTNNPLNVLVNSTTNYTVIGFGSNGCTGKATQLISVLGTPTVVVNPPFICPGMTNTITASGANTYTWYINSPATQTLIQQTILVNPNSPTVYSVCGTSSNFGCVGCTSITLGPAAPVQISVSDVTVCTTANLCQTVVATSTLTAPVNYTWQPAGVTGSLVSICPTASGIYTVSATSPSGCPSSSLFAVTVATNCCGQPTVGLTRLTTLTGPITNGAYLIDSPLSLGNSASFQNAEVWMTPEAKITVPAPWTLTLDKAHLFSCGSYMWHGIDIQDGGRIITPSAASQTLGSLIEDAEVAIKLDNISLLNSSPNAPIEIEGVVFNKNFIGIKVSNSDATLDTLALGISGCVFASRDMTFTTHPATTLDWPSADAGGIGLRVANSSTSGLAPPHTFPNLPQSNNLKAPHNGQPGHIGIKIENIGGTTIGNGIQIGLTYPGAGLSSFNLFDGLGVGIDVTDASLTTMNNVFQSMQSYPYALSSTGTFGGSGISSVVAGTGLKNVRLKLKGTAMTDDGNRFWDCLTGIYGDNVFELWVKYCTFRSTQIFQNVKLSFPMPGDKGIHLVTNRFDFTVRNCEFNNLKNGVIFETPLQTQNFDMGNGAIAGIYAVGVSVEQSYFGALVTSGAIYAPGITQSGFSEYLGDAIQISTPNTNGAWIDVAGSFIWANKIDRAFRGITINGMESHSQWIWGNSIYIEDDIITVPPQLGYGISVTNKFDNLAIRANTLHANFSSQNDNVSLVYCDNNMGKGSPVIECNYLSDSHYGFHFEGQNPGTVWEKNEMCNHFAGLALVNNAVIGQQGTLSNGCGNLWNTACNPWGSPSAMWETYCDNSNPGFSPLYVYNTTSGFEPLVNGAAGGAPYSAGADIFYSTGNLECTYPSFTNDVPSWRKANVGADTALVKELPLVKGMKVYPNPTNGRLIISKPESIKAIAVGIFDLNGRRVFTAQDISTELELHVEFLAPAVYMLEVREQEGILLRQKLIKIN